MGKKKIFILQSNYIVLDVCLKTTEPEGDA